MNDPNQTSADPSRDGAARPSRWGVVGGLAIAFAVPLVSLGVALLWDNGILTLDPNGPFVQGVQGLAMPGLFLGPLGLVLALWAARVRSLLIWIASLIVGIPLLAVLWFVGVAYLGGLAGEPF